VFTPGPTARAWRSRTAFRNRRPVSWRVSNPVSPGSHHEADQAVGDWFDAPSPVSPNTGGLAFKQKAVSPVRRSLHPRNIQR